MTAVVVQCRMASKRLPGKALLMLGGKTVLQWVLDAMRLVQAERYVLATDVSSAEKLFPIARQCGWECFAGSEDDVLGRFCSVIEMTGADTVLRATADNPFLFYEAASALVSEFEKQPCDYMTWTGLPHGSGVEIFNASSLVRSAQLTSLAYDHEHVGPALYNHPEHFNSIMLEAPAHWNKNSLRTTIDTYDDYRRALRLVRFAAGSAAAGNKVIKKPFTAVEIIEAASSAQVLYPILVVPSVKKGRGTGHLRRCIDIAAHSGADVFIPETADLAGISSILEDARTSADPLHSWQIVCALDSSKGAGAAGSSYALVAADTYALTLQQISELHHLGPLAAIDDGSRYHKHCDYLLDIIPSLQKKRTVNSTNPLFIPLPKNRRPESRSKIVKVLVAVGGEDPAGISLPAASAFSALGYAVTVIVPQKNRLRSFQDAQISGLHILENQPLLREKLHSYDLVVTHYGFTAFEAVAAGCAVILAGTSAVHEKLARRYGFACLPYAAARLQKKTAQCVEKLMKNPSRLYSVSPDLEILRSSEPQNLADFILTLASGTHYDCPVCGQSKISEPNTIISRTFDKTIRRCRTCRMMYVSWSMQQKMEYSKNYFFDDYKKQYGKTYLEDFSAIKAHCIGRMSVIDFLYRKFNSHRIHRNTSYTPSVLDVGCAYGPFLSAAADSGWNAFGTDISSEAVAYVQNELHIPAFQSAFPAINTADVFSCGQFDCVAMWYVIEHFSALHEVLEKVSAITAAGGIFAFSTPSGSGISRLNSSRSFFTKSPADHFTIWEPMRTAAVMRRYGFKVVKIISTGFHAERFTFFSKFFNINKFPFAVLVLKAVSRIFLLGDTFEVYCVKKTHKDKK